MAWTTIDTNDLLPGEPFTAAKALALYENPGEGLAGATGSPINAAAWHPYNRTEVGGSETGVIWSQAVDGTIADIETPTLAANYDYAVYFDEVRCSSNTQTLRARVDRIGDTYTTSVDISTAVSSTAVLTGILHMPFPGVDSKGVAPRWINPFCDGTADCSASGFINIGNTARTWNKASFTWSAGSFNNGRVILLRRLAFVP